MHRGPQHPLHSAELVFKIDPTLHSRRRKRSFDEQSRMFRGLDVGGC
jgi:hypothetical protein